MPKSQNILIAGGGIAGLTAALAIRATGAISNHIQLFEKSDGNQTGGAGIQISPNAMRVLHEIGLGKQIRAAGTSIGGIHIYKASTSWPIKTIELGAYALQRFGMPYLSFHRSDLHQILMSAAENEPAIGLYSGSTVSDFSIHENGVSALVNRGEKITQNRGNLLVIADGVHSNLRAQLVEEDPRHFQPAKPSGLCAWRAMIPQARIPEKFSTDHVSLILDKKTHCVVYPVKAGRYLNVALILPDRRMAEVQTTADTAWLFEAIKTWHPRFKWLIEAAQSWTRWPLFETPSGSFLSKKIALVGDAAHAMLPFAAQGAALAMEDGFVLARSLAAISQTKHDDDMTGARLIDDEKIDTALENYQMQRLARINRARRFSRRNGRIYHFGLPLSLARNLALGLMPSHRFLERQAWLYDWRP